MFKNRHYNNSKKQITYFSKSSTFNKTSFINKNNTNDNYMRKRISSIRNKILEKEFNDSIKEYSDFKSAIHLKKARDSLRQKKIDEKINNIKNLERNMNFTTIVKYIDIALNKDNPFKNYNLKNKLDELENFNRNIYRNKIGIILTKKILHGAKIKSKIDIEKQKDLTFNNIYQKIKNSQANFHKSQMIQSEKNSELGKYCIIRNPSIKNRSNNTDFLRLKKNGLNNNKNMSLIHTINNESSSFKNSDHLNMKLAKPHNDINLNLNCSTNLVRNKRKSLNQNLSIFNRNNNSGLNDNDKIWSKISSVNQSFSSNCNFGSLSKINNRLNKYRKIKNCNKKSNLKLNNIINRTIANTKSIDKKYKFLIDGLYRDFRKIKSNTSKLLTKYKEWGFSSAKSIDEIVKTKEDMQLFHLKQKYFRHMKLFPKNKKSKRTNISMINTLKNNFDLFDLDEK